MFSFTLLFISLIAGFLTVLAPCTIALLPIIVGGTLSGGTSFKKAFIVTFSLGISVILFTLLLKVSLLFINIPESFWQIFSGIIIILLGFTIIFPSILNRFSFINKANRDLNKVIATGYKKENILGDILIGVALGPVFSTCSPTYFLIIATVIPQSFTVGIIYLFAYTFGLCSLLFVIAIAGQKLLEVFGVLSDPKGLLKRIIGFIFLVLGIIILFGYDKKIELIASNHLFDITSIEQNLLKNQNKQDEVFNTSSTTSTSTYKSENTNKIVLKTYAQKLKLYPLAPEITNPDSFINTGGNPITIGQFKGKKVVLVDFWTYSCINCQRTLPFVKTWYDKYKDYGFEIISIHTPEFAFEHLLSNVSKAVSELNIKYPVVLDNNYGTWGAFGNNYWPRKYLIDTDGFIIYDHIGEGNYDETEQAIQEALIERAVSLGEPIPDFSSSTKISETKIETNSPETYFGSNRNSYLGNGTSALSGIQDFTLPSIFFTNTLYLSGKWNIMPEYAESISNNEIDYKYNAKSLYFVAGTNGGSIDLEVQLDGAPLDSVHAGTDIFIKNNKSYVTVSTNKLYKLVESQNIETHTIKISVPKAGLQAFTFTFG